MKKIYSISIFLISSALTIYIAFFFKDQLSHFESLGFLGIFLINLIGNATILIPVPALAAVVAGGALYNPIAVGFVSAVGASIGEMTGFIVGKGKENSINKKRGKFWEFVYKHLENRGFLVIFFFAFIPNPAFDVIGIAAGIVKYSPIKFLLAVFAGRFLRNIVFAYLGSKL